MRQIAPYFYLVASALFAFGQETQAQVGKEYQEVWPSVDVYYRVNPKLRLYGTLAGTKKESSYADGAVGVFVDYFTFPLARIFRMNHSDSLPGRMLWLRGGYQYSTTPPSAEDPFKENILVTEVNGRVSLPFELLLTLKNRFDWRFSSGDFNGRYRPRISLERDVKTDYMFFTLYGQVEYYANFGNTAVNRTRTQVGVDFRVTRVLNFEVFWNHQYENAPEIPTVDAFGTTFKFFFKKNTKALASNR